MGDEGLDKLKRENTHEFCRVYSNSSHNILSFWAPNFMGPNLLAARFASISFNRCCFRSSRFRFASSIRDDFSVSSLTGVNLVLLQSSPPSFQESSCFGIMAATGSGFTDKRDKLGIGKSLLLGAGLLSTCGFGFTSLNDSQSSSSSSQPSAAFWFDDAVDAREGTTFCCELPKEVF